MNTITTNAEPSSFLADITFGAVRQFMAAETKIFEATLRKQAHPIIKGEITKGKLSWRGIKVVHEIDGSTRKTWLEQRGKRIGQKIMSKAL